jgi:PAS domain S-box-containing protein
MPPDGLFVTLFHARLTLATGRLRYVDAGHGYCLLRRAGGAVQRLGARSLPLGIDPSEDLTEGEVTLDHGDALVVCSDGLVELDETPVALDQALAGLAPGAGAAATADWLMGRITDPLSDDVTVVVLRRLAPAAPVAEPEPAGPRPGAAFPARMGGPERPAGASGPPRAETGPPLAEEESVAAVVLRFLRTPGYSASAYAMTAVTAAAVFLEWRVGTDAVGLRHPDGRTILLAFAAPLAASLPWMLLSLSASIRSIKVGLSPLPVLASRARQIAAGARVPIPYRDRDDEIGDLAIALQEWQEAAAVRDVILRRAPLGISRLDSSGVVLSCNDAVCAILGRTRDEIEGHPLLELVNPEDIHVVDVVTRALAVPGTDRVAADARLRRGDGSWLWCSTVVAPIRSDEDRVEGFIHILEDVSERQRETQWASAVQREMLPTVPPRLAGYEVAGRCLTALDVAGDLFDWADTGDGHLEVTLADVMGKGMGAALLMAALRTALRAAPGELGPGERVQRAADSMTFGAGADGLFVTLFHASLELATGVFRYVDAGHGYVLVRRAGGLLERLPVRSVPLGIGMNQPFVEGVARLAPGDLLLACSDGLLETSEDAVDIDALGAGLRPESGAAAVVDRLLDRVAGGSLTDDVTVVVVRRLSGEDDHTPAPVPDEEAEAAVGQAGQDVSPGDDADDPRLRPAAHRPVTGNVAGM